MPATRRVLIGLPAYNEKIALPRLLARIESLRQTSSKAMTVVLSNDGSIDATPATAHAWQQRLPLIVLNGVVKRGWARACAHWSNMQLPMAQMTTCSLSWIATTPTIRRRSKRCSHVWQKALTW
jgi:glycosyltransferase involved in cell wall biosynthesis